MKSMLRLMLCLLICMLLAASALADTEGDYTYYIDTMIGGTVLTGYTGSGTDVVVPDTLGGYPVLRLSYGAFHGNTAIESVILPDSLQYMDGGAFHSNTNLKSVYLPEYLIEFYNMSSSGSYYFYVDKDSATARLMVGSSVYSAGFIDPEFPSFTLYYTQSPVTGSVILAVGKYIGHEETVTIPDGVSHIGNSAFMIGISGAEVNTWTKTVHMPSSIISLGMAAVYSLPNLAEVYLSPNISSWYHTTQPWEPGAFSEGAKLYCSLDSTTFRTMTQDVTPLGIVDPDNPDFAWQSDGSGGRILCNYYGHADNLVIPEGTTALGKEIFYENLTLSSITLPEGLRTIGKSAFYGNHNLSSVHFASGLTTIGDYAFYNTPKLLSVRFPDTLTQIGQHAFTGEEYPYPEGYVQPDFTAWLPDNVTFGLNPFDANRNNAFYCSYGSKTGNNLCSTHPLYSYIDPKDPDWGWKVDPDGTPTLVKYYGDSSHITVPDYVTSIGDNAFHLENPSVYPTRTIYLPDNISIISSSAFTSSKDKDNLIVNFDSITAQTIAQVNNDNNSILIAFCDPQYPDYKIAPYLGEIHVMSYLGSDSVLNIPPFSNVIDSGIGFFSPNRHLVHSIILPEGLTRIEAHAFASWPTLTKISLPSTLKYIGESALSSNFDGLVIPDGITSLPPQMCYSIVRYVTIPDSVQSIDDTTFFTARDHYARVYGVFCNPGSYAEKWATEKKIPVTYLNSGEYMLRPRTDFSIDVGETYDWKSFVTVMPQQPDFPYTLNISSSDPNIVSVVNNELVFKSHGTVTLTISSPELKTSAKIPNLQVFKPIEDFSVPAYHFIKYAANSKKILSVSNVTPAQNTNPVYVWHQPEANNYSSYTAITDKFPLQDIPASGVWPLEITAHNGIKRSTTLVYYQTLGASVFEPFTGTLAAGMTILPDITVTVDNNAYEGIPATYTLTSSNTAVAKPTSDGRLELLSPGTATITAKFLNGKTAKQTLTVSGEKVYTIAPGVKKIEQEAFLSCPVTIAIIPDGCVSIGARAFADCADMHRIEIPASVTAIAEDAFDGCSGTLVIAAPEDSAAAEFAAAHGFALDAK